MFHLHPIDAGGDITADSINAVVTASGNKIPGYYADLYATYIEKAGGVEKFMEKPSGGGGGGGGGGGAAAAAAAPAAAAAKPKEEEVDALEGGMVSTSHEFKLSQKKFMSHLTIQKCN